MGTSSYLTRDSIVTEGLELGGNPGLTTRANIFLAMLLDHMFRAYDWEFLLKTTTVQSDANNFGKISNAALPADYRAVRQLFDSSGDQTSALDQVAYETLLIPINNDNSRGQTTTTAPEKFATDEGNGSGASDIYLWPKPATRRTFILRYYALPDVSAYTGSSKVEFPDAYALVGAVAHYAQAYDQQNLQGIIKQEAKQISDEYRINHRDRGRASTETLPMDESVYRVLRQDGQLPWPKPQ